MYHLFKCALRVRLTWFEPLVFYRIAWLTPEGDCNIPQMIQNGKIMHNLHLVSIQMARAVKEKLFLFEKKVQSLGSGLHALDLCLEREFPDAFPSPSPFAVVWKSEAELETRICLGQYICVSVEQANHALHPHVISWHRNSHNKAKSTCAKSLYCNYDAIWRGGRE